MSQGTTIHVVTRGDLTAGGPTGSWRDPHGWVPLSEPKRHALLANPLAGGDDEPVQLVGVVDGEVRGRIDLVPGIINVRGEAVCVHYGSNLFVPPEHRGSLLGVTLILKSQQACETVAASGPSNAALPVYEKLRWFDIPLRRYVLIRHSRSILRRYLGDHALAHALAPLADLGLALPRLAVRSAAALATRGLHVERAERMPVEWDAHLAECDAPIATHRSVAYINWLLEHTFDDDPRLKKRLLLIHDERGEPLGYLLLRVKFYEKATHRAFPDLLLGSMKDWMIFDRTRLSLSKLIHIAVRELGEMGADAVEVCLKSEETPRWLRAAGFIPAGTMHMVFRARPGTPLADPQNQKPELWRVRPADGDSFFA